MARALCLRHISLTVSDLSRATDFYTEALGCTRTMGPRPASPELLAALDLPEQNARLERLRLGAQEVELIQFATPGRPYPPGSTATDLWFQHIAIATSDIAATYARISASKSASAITCGGPQHLPASSGGVTAWKFRDCDGHPLELIAFCPDAVPAVWRGAPSRPSIMGIDHSAISIADTTRSIAFYHDTLGLAVASRQENLGEEQERLDATAGARAEIVALDPPGAATPHVELLAYRTPRGRPIPPNARADDIAASRLVFTTDELPGSAERRLMHDPDGHLVLLVALGAE